MIDSLTEHGKSQLVINQSYWTFYMDTTNKGDSLRNVIPIFKTKLIRRTNNSWGGSYLEFDVSEMPKCGDTMQHNLPTYMNGYGSAYCEFYDSEQEAKNGFDNKIRKIAKRNSAAKRDIMYKKMYNKVAPIQPQLEVDAKIWKTNLSQQEKKYLDWWLNNSK